MNCLLPSQACIKATSPPSLLLPHSPFQRFILSSNLNLYYIVLNFPKSYSWLLWHKLTEGDISFMSTHHHEDQSQWQAMRCEDLLSVEIYNIEVVQRTLKVANAYRIWIKPNPTNTSIHPNAGCKSRNKMFSHKSKNLGNQMTRSRQRMMMFVLIWSSNLQSMSIYFLDQSACLHDVEIKKSMLILYSHNNRD